MAEERTTAWKLRGGQSAPPSVPLKRIPIVCVSSRDHQHISYSNMLIWALQYVVKSLSTTEILLEMLEHIKKLPAVSTNATPCDILTRHRDIVHKF